ncbi:MAG: NAD+ synthase [bacterium]
MSREGFPHSLPPLPVKSACREIVGFLRRFTRASRPRCVLGLSGGLDSAVTAFLLVRSLERDAIKVVIMPYHAGNIEDALLVVEALGIDHVIMDIGPCIDTYYAQCPDADRFRKGNKMARERMAVLYDIAAERRAIVVGTGNRSEILLGYFTKYGDGGVDVEPLGGLYKTHVYELARYLKVPDSILTKPPSADLWPGQRDDEELGVGYEEADAILYSMIDRGKDRDELLHLGFDPGRVDRIIELVEYSQHKRCMPPIPDMLGIFP